ncbi:hypothetical protein BGW42_007291 [Actinomortierella wolfii]|nr:hypothetical protein BGW42_007291 [Actinomortierella wolfii]
MVLPQGNFVFCERRRTIDICKGENDVIIVNADVILEGYQVYLVEQWVTERKREIDTAISFTGDPFHKIRAVAIRIDKPGVQCKRLEEIFETLKADGARRKSTNFGDVFVTNLSLFTSSLNIVHVPDGDFDLYKHRFYLNLNLRRMGCSGRSALTLKSPSDAQREKFNQLYKISDSAEFEETVIRLVIIVQNCLYIFGLFNPHWIDGLLCTSTEYALDEFYDRFLMDQFQRPVIRETKLEPNVLAGLLSKLSNIRSKLQHLVNNVPKDPFAEPEAFINSIKTYQTSFNPQGLKVHKVLKSKIEDFSGMPTVNLEGETTDLEVFTKHIHSESLKMLWRGKPKHKPDVADALASGDWLTGGKELGKSLVRGLAKTTRETKSKSQALKSTIAGPRSDDERGGERTAHLFGTRVAKHFGMGEETDEGVFNQGHATAAGDGRGARILVTTGNAGSHDLSEEDDNMTATVAAGSSTTLSTGTPTTATAATHGRHMTTASVGANAFNGFPGGIFGQLQRQQNQDQQQQQQQQAQPQQQSESGYVDGINFDMSLQTCMAQSPCQPGQPEIVYFDLTPRHRRPLMMPSPSPVSEAQLMSNSLDRLANAKQRRSRTKSMSDLKLQERVLGCRAEASWAIGDIPGVRAWSGSKRFQFLTQPLAPTATTALSPSWVDERSKDRRLRKRSQSMSIGMERRAKEERYLRGVHLWGDSVVPPFGYLLDHQHQNKGNTYKGEWRFNKGEYEPLTRLEIDSGLQSYYLHQALKEKEDALRILCKQMDDFGQELAAKLDPLKAILAERTKEFIEVEQEAHRLLSERRELLEDVQAKEHATQRSIYHLESMVGKLVEMRDFTGAFFSKIHYLDTKLPVSHRRLAIWVDRLQALQYHWLRTIGGYMTAYAPSPIRNRFTQWEHKLQEATMHARELRGEYRGNDDLTAINTAVAVAAAAAGISVRAGAHEHDQQQKQQQQQPPHQQEEEQKTQQIIPCDKDKSPLVQSGLGGRGPHHTGMPGVIDSILASMGIFMPRSPSPPCLGGSDVSPTTSSSPMPAVTTTAMADTNNQGSSSTLKYATSAEGETPPVSSSSNITTATAPGAFPEAKAAGSPSTDKRMLSMTITAAVQDNCRSREMSILSSSSSSAPFRSASSGVP